MFTDTHCHLTSEDYNDLESIIENAKINGITKMINNGFDRKSNEEVIEISRKFSNVYAAIGFHPSCAELVKENDYAFIENNIEKIVAIGEIGLDYHYESFDKEKQKEVLERQLKLAEKYHKPVIIHSREATEDTLNILKKYPAVTGSIHCFSGSLETAKTYIKMGYKLGFNGVITFKNAKIKNIIKDIPDSSIILETDSPYLAPEPSRGQINEPKNIIHIAKYISNIKNITMEELALITENNVKTLFDI